MKQYDDNKYRRLGVGEKVESTDFFMGIDETIEDQPEPAESIAGCVVDADDELLFLRPITISLGNTPTDALEAIAASQGITTDMGKKALAVALECLRVLDSKQKDYGSANIGAFGEYGVLVRVWDKVSRLRNLIGNVASPKNESINDSWLDLCNYAIIAQICRKGEWK